tara:strand:- start:4674 stop:7559 length:2886 start_codon:yes stop_codon:yes gene_type:complete
MAAKYPELDIYPKEGMDVREVQKPEWISNLWQPNGVSYMEVRPGFGQRAQFSSQASTSLVIDGTTWTVGANGYEKHLGSYLYNTLYGHRQILSVFSAKLSLTDTLDPTQPGVGYMASSANLFYSCRTLHGFRNGIVFSVYDLTTDEHYEEVFALHTAQTTRTNEMIQTAHGNFESYTSGRGFGVSGTATGDSGDFRGVHSGDEASPVSFEQMMDSVVISSPDFGVWQYFGIDPVGPNNPRVEAANPDRQLLVYLSKAAPGTYVPPCNFFGSGKSESSALVPIVGTRGKAGQFVYFDDTEFPKINAAAILGNVMCYASDSAIFFSDPGHAGSILGGNFVVANFDTPIVALEAWGGNLYAFTTNETWLVTVNYSTVNVDEPAKIVASAIRISESIGCVGPRSVSATPIGLCWVSSSGVHALASERRVATISDPIFQYWKDGLEDPVTNFHISAVPGATDQPSAVYSHSGQPTLAFNKSDDSLLIAYEDHILAYNTVTKMWCVWPLKSLQKLSYGSTQNVREYKPINCLNILADAEGTYIVGGFTDPNQTVSGNYVAGNSFYVLEFTRGGGLDRSAKPTDDKRLFGQYQTRPYIADTATLANNDPNFVVHIKPPTYYESDLTSPARAYVEFDIEFTSLFYAAFNRAGNTGVVIPIEYDGSWTWDGFYTDPYVSKTPVQGAGGAANVAVSLAPAATPSGNKTLTISYNDATGTAGQPMTSYGKTIKVGKMRFYKNLPLAATDTNLVLIPTANWLVSPNQTAVAYDAAGNQLPAYAWSAATSLTSGAFRQFENQEAGTVQYAYKSGMVGIDQEKSLRARSIYALLESSGEADVSRSLAPTFGLYNTIMAGDRRLMSAQYLDYVGQAGGRGKGEVMISKSATIRKRLNAGKRTFGGGAKYRSTSVQDAYFVDSPERNIIATSASARGSSIAAMIFGFVSDKAQRLRIHKLFMSVVAWGGGRRRKTHR